MTDTGKRADDLLDAFSERGKQIVHARNLIEEFALADPTLWPILSEIDLALTPKDGKVHAGH